MHFAEYCAILLHIKKDIAMQLMSIEDLAAYLCVSKRTIYKYIASGDCPPYIKLSKKNISFDRVDVDAWLESKKVVPEHKETYMYQKRLPWTPRAKQVLKVAEQTAHRYELDYVGTEHLLLGIVEVKECLGAGILRSLGVDQVKVRELYEQLRKDMKVEVVQKAAGDKSNLTENTHKAIRSASEQAVRWGHEYVGAEHLLAGILLVGDGLGCQILAQLGVTADRVHSETSKLIVCRSERTQ